MGEKVSKMKKGIINNLVKKVEFDEASKITTQEMIDLLAAITAQNNRSVTQFCITGANVLTDDAAKSMNTLLKGYSTETVKERKAGSLGIALKECDFSSQGLNALLTSFFYCDIVGELIIHGTFKPLEESSIQGLEQVLMGQGTKCCISKLELKGFAVSSKITRALVELMAKQKIVKQLYLLKFEVRADAVKILLQQSSLELLDLSGCEIADAHIDTMTEALQQNTTLKKLVLDDNNITDAGVQKLIQGIVRVFLLILIYFFHSLKTRCPHWKAFPWPVIP